MRILLHAKHVPVASGRYMRDAFRRIGVDVRSIGEPTGGQIWRIELDASHAWIPNGPADAYWPDWKPDLVLIMSLEPFHHPRYDDVPHAVYSVDNHVWQLRQPGVSHYFLAHRNGQATPVGPDDTTWLPCAYDPHFFTPSPIPWEKRQVDLTLIGVMYEQRIAALEAIKRVPGIMVGAGTGAVYEQYRDVYQNTRISLCVSIRSDVAIRIFETAAMGCLVLTDPLPDLEPLQARGLVTYESPEDAAEKVRYYLAHPDEAKALVEQSTAWAKPHTWDARARTIVDWCVERFGRV